MTQVTLDVYRRVLAEFIATVGSDPHAYSPQLDFGMLSTVAQPWPGVASC